MTCLKESGYKWLLIGATIFCFLVSGTILFLGLLAGGLVGVILLMFGLAILFITFIASGLLIEAYKFKENTLQSRKTLIK